MADDFVSVDEISRPIGRAEYRKIRARLKHRFTDRAAGVSPGTKHVDADAQVLEGAKLLIKLGVHFCVLTR